MLKNYKDGADLTIMNAVYNGPKKDSVTEKWSNPTMTVMYKDNQTGLKGHEVISNPDFKFYMANDDVYIDENEFPEFLPLEMVHPVVCKYKDREKDIAKLTGRLDEYYDNIRTGNRRLNSLMHRSNRLYLSDMNIEDHYRFEFGLKYSNNINAINKAFFDIEVDGINAIGDFPTPEDSPVNAVTLIDLGHNQVYTYLLRNKDNPLIEEFEGEVKEGQIFSELQAFITDAVGGYKAAHRYGIDKLEYNFLFYDEEIQLIHDLFIGINTLQPDFLLAWNMSFDVPFLINRIQYLGYNPEEIMCHPDFENKQVVYYMDERNQNDLPERGDFAKISCYTIYLDQMIQFASRRKGQHAFKSFKLDDIGWDVARVHKLDYHHISSSLVKLPYVDYKTFVFYNIMDVIVQVCIEKKTGDLDYVFGKCISNNTRYSKAHRQTVYLANRAAREYYDMGFVMGNNINKWNPKPDTKFKGAYVADPWLLSDYPKKMINGHTVDICDNADDYDYARLYPSVMQEFNMSSHTQKGKIIIPNALHDKDNRFGDDRYDRGGAFIEDLQSHIFLEFGSRWLHLAEYGELVGDVKEFYTTQMTPMGPLEIVDYNGKPLYKPIIQMTGLRNPLTKNVNLTKPLIKYRTPDFDRLKEFYDKEIK